MIAGQGGVEYCRNALLAVFDHHLLGCLAQRQNGAHGRIHDGCKLGDPVHAEVRNGERAAGNVFLGQLTRLRFVSEFGCGSGDFSRRLAVSVIDGGRVEAIVGGDRNRDMSCIELMNVIAHQIHINAGLLH